MNTNFGTGGLVRTELGTDVDTAKDVAVQSDEKIVVAGDTCSGCRFGNFSTRDFALARYNPDGSLDQSFGNNGLVVTDFAGLGDSVSDMVIRGDGKIIVVGSTQIAGGGSEFAIARYNPDGSPDISFGNNGLLTTSFNDGFSTGAANSVTLFGTERMVVAGSATGVDGTEDVAFARYDNFGNLDTSFGTDGRVLIPDQFPGSSAERITKVETYPQTNALVKTIMAFGETTSGPTPQDFLLMRLNDDGSLDTSFDTDGIFTLDIEDFDFAGDMALYQRGPSAGSPQIIITGGVANEEGTSRLFFTARFFTDGSFDSTFSNDGMDTIDFGESNNQAFSVFVQPGDGILVAGLTDDGGSGSDFAIARYTNIGTLDPTFGTGGLVTTDLEIMDVANAIALTPDGNIIAAGEVGLLSDNFDFGLACYNNQLTHGVVSDFDGDGRTDLSVFRPGEGNWYLSYSSNGGFTGFPFGLDTDILVPGDYDGDTVTDAAVFRPSNGTWYVFYALFSYGVFQWGSNGDIPVPGDYNGDRVTDFAVFRPNEGTWYIHTGSPGSNVRIEQFGQQDDIPVPGDYDGDGQTDLAVFRPGDRNWYISGSRFGNVNIIQFGLSTDSPVQADYDGDGLTDISVFRPTDQTWYLMQSSNGFSAIRFGMSTDIPAPGDYDGDGQTDIAVFRPSNGSWWMLQSTNGLRVENFGVNGDIPLPSTYIP
ncbi:MAG: FG-GAP-like repeat-containing protein [Pyrinomonadaceae bacterium]